MEGAILGAPRFGSKIPIHFFPQTMLEHFYGMGGHETFPVHFSLITITVVPLSKASWTHLLQWSCSAASRSDCGCTGQLPGVNVSIFLLQRWAGLSVKPLWIKRENIWCFDKKKKKNEGTSPCALKHKMKSKLWVQRCILVRNMLKAKGYAVEKTDPIICSLNELSFRFWVNFGWIWQL